MNKLCALVLACLCGLLMADVRALAAATPPGPQLFLVENGVSRAPIIVFKDAPPFTRKAANDLAEYIEKISGARPEVIEGTPDPIPEHAVWVGYQPVLKKLFPKVDFDFKYPEEILIAANEKHLVIAGRDKWDPDHMVVKGKRNTVNGIQREYGTVNAVYTFLQDFLDVRWIWPGELGEDIIEQKTIAFLPFEYRYHPQVRGRGGLMAYSSLGNIGRSEDWTRHQRLQLDSLNVPAGHAFSKWWQKYYEEHPDYFALQPDGTRGTWPPPLTGQHAGGYIKLCQSNPQIWDQWFAEVEEKLEKDPTLNVFSVCPNDGPNDGICVCEKCRAWDNPDGAPCLFNWLGFGQDYVTMSDRYLTFARHLDKKLLDRYPDKDYHILLHAYGSTRLPPAAAIPPDNLLLSYVGSFPWGTDKGREISKENIRGWMERGNHKLIYRPNSGRQPGLPEVHLKRTMEDFKFLSHHKLVGIFIDAVWEHWATCGPQYYLMGLLTWDPGLDGEAIMGDYYRRGFGPAAGDVQAYFSLFERAREYYLNNPNQAPYSGPFTMNLIHQAQALLDRAAARVADDPKYRQRVEFIQAGLDHSKLVVENYAWMDRLRESDGADETAAAKAKENYEQMKTIWKKYPLAINGAFLQPGSRRFRNLHPDASYGAKMQKIDEFKEPEKVTPAEESGWELTFSDNFDRNELGNEWEAFEGVWTVKDGALHGAGTLISNSDALRAKKGDYQRFEFEATADVESILTFPGKPAPNIDVCDVSSFIHSQFPRDKENPIFSGFFFQFGGMHNKQNRILKGKKDCTLNRKAKKVITPGKPHKIVVENDHGHLKHFVDGELIQEYKDKSPLKPEPDQNQVGFYFYTNGKVSNVKVYTKPACSPKD